MKDGVGQTSQRGSRDNVCQLYQQLLEEMELNDCVSVVVMKTPINLTTGYCES